MSEFLNYKIVCVKWLDPSNETDSNIRRIHVSLGFVIEENEEQIVLGLGFYPNNEPQFEIILKIPKSCIQERFDLGKLTKTEE